MLKTKKIPKEHHEYALPFTPSLIFTYCNAFVYFSFIHAIECLSAMLQAIH